MELTFSSRLKHAWDVFRNREPTYDYQDTGPSTSYRPDRTRLTGGNERSIVTSIFNRIALDVSSINVKHCRIDENGRFKEQINSGLDNCLNLEANIDQTGRAFMQDVVMSMLDEGCVAIIPTDTTLDPTVTTSYDIQAMRTGKILDWYPNHIRVRVYNEKTGKQEDIKLPKSMVAIVENPLYAVINEPNSTMQRLMKKLVLLDAVDENTRSGKLDMIIQLPYVIKSDARKAQADKRRKDIEEQLKGPYGIAYVDGTEKIIQLNRPIENNLMKQIEYLTNLLYSQLGVTAEVLNGTADEKTMLNYNNRTVEPIISAIVDEMKRKFLTKTARSQLQTIKFFRDPFRLVPVNDIAEIADKFTRNEILTSNEIRQIIGMKPSDDPKADKLVNSNLNQPDEQVPPEETSQDEAYQEDVPQEVDSEEPRSLGDIPISSLPPLEE
nr:MAG TPA: portal protein [Caudoviricetes sp.]